ncbi:MAG: HAD-IIIC family phosphatase [Candidatus Sungbacteria bacterium]|nr:HAD-IIIC family phosphatase [Candidatus Sungbacteria bacterium]
MKFSDLQQEVSALVDKGESSSAPYLLCANNMDVFEDGTPSYVRTVRAAFLGSYTLQGLAEVYRARGIFHNILVQVYTAPYNQFSQEILASESGLHTFNPDLVYLLLDAPDLLSTTHLADLIAALLERTRAQIIIFNFVSGPRIDETAVVERNRQLAALCGENTRTHLFDFHSFLERIGKDAHWYTKYADLGDLRLSPAAFPALAESLLGYAVAHAGNTKKCAVLDLDNTLWQGIVGEDGPENIVPDRKLQTHLLSLFEKGIILALDSKNNEEDALPIFENCPDMVLRKNHIAAWRVNWESKEKNIAELAEELNLGTESFVFVDDDPFQRGAVRTAFPEIAVLSPEQIYDYAGFCSFAITDEDRRRGSMYAEERQRRELKGSLRTEEDFLKELDLHVVMNEVSDETMARVSQLTQKTNQFNLTTRRYGEDDIRRLLGKGWRVWTIGVTDRFGDYGTTGVVMIEPQSADEWRVDNFLLSCRVLGRKVEDRLVAHLIDAAGRAGVRTIHAEYRASSKNRQTESFWDRMAFTRIKEDNEHTLYRHELTVAT